MKILSIILGTVTICMQLSAQTESGKILYKGIQSKDKNSSQIAEKFSASLKSKLEEKTAKKNQTLAMPENMQTEELACETDVCLKKILETANTEEMIFGFMNREKDRVRLKMKSVRLQNGFLRTKSEFNEMFTDIELLNIHYANETAEKLLNPAYRIKRINLAEPADEKNIKRLETKSETSGLKVPNYGGGDDRIARLVSVLEPDLEKADALYNEEKYDAAIDAYTDILLKIAGRLPNDRHPQMRNYADSVSKKLEASYKIILRQHVEYLDIRMDECRPLKNCDIAELNEWVDSGFKWKASAPTHMQDRLKTFIPLLNSRRDALQLWGTDLLETEGNELYNKKEYENAILKFEQADKELSAVSDKALRKKYSDRFRHKVKLSNEYGRKDLCAKVQSLADEAEELNLVKKEEEARSKMNTASSVLTSSRFQSSEAYRIYNKIGAVMNLPLLVQNAKPDEGTSRKKAAPNRRKKKKR